MLEKCKLFKQELLYLGSLIEATRICSDLAKVEVDKDINGRSCVPGIL